MMGWFRTTLVACVIVVGLLLAGCGQNQGPTKVAIHVWPGYEFLFLARSLGLLDPNKVELVETQSASGTLELLKQGKVDGGALTLDEVIRCRSLGIPLSVVLVVDASAGADVILARPEIKTLTDLKGKKIGVETGAVGSIMLDQGLASAGLKVDDVVVLESSIDQHLEGWENNLFDAVITYEPVSSQIKALGGQMIFSSREAKDLIVDVMAFRTEALKNSDSITHLIQAHYAALKHFSTNRWDAYYRMAPRLGLQPEQVSQTFQGLILPDEANNRRLLSGPKPAILVSAEKLSKIMTSAGMIDDAISFRGLINDSFLLRAQP